MHRGLRHRRRFAQRRTRQRPLHCDRRCVQDGSRQRDYHDGYRHQSADDCDRRVPYDRRFAGHDQTAQEDQSGSSERSGRHCGGCRVILFSCNFKNVTFLKYCIPSKLLILA